MLGYVHFVTRLPVMDQLSSNDLVPIASTAALVHPYDLPFTLAHVDFKVDRIDAVL